MTVETQEPSGSRNEKKAVVITDIKMPFWSMVVFIFKWTLASVPAMFILGIVGTIIWTAMAALFMGSGGLWV
jgi:hypothetical protein